MEHLQNATKRSCSRQQQGLVDAENTDVQEEQHNPAYAESGWRKEPGNNKQEKRFPSTRHSCQDRNMYGESTEEDRWLGFVHGMKSVKKGTLNEIDRRDGKLLRPVTAASRGAILF